MSKLNLATKNEEQERIKAYLEENASDVLIKKINDGIEIVKDNKLVVNKKDLDGFMNFAYEEASKLNTNKNRVLAISKDTVFGWAIHYFEESSIEGTLYNTDGTEYKPEIKKVEKPKVEVKKEPEKPKNTQGSFFEMFSETKENEPKIDTKTEEDVVEEEMLETPEFEDYKDELFDEDDFEIDKTTGEVLTIPKPTENNIYADKLKAILGNQLKLEV